MTNTCCALISEREEPDIFSSRMFAGSTDYRRFTGPNLSGNRLGREVSSTLGVPHFKPNHLLNGIPSSTSFTTNSQGVVYTCSGGHGVDRPGIAG